MKTTKLIIAMASMVMLASCGGNAPASTPAASSEPSASSEAKKTMGFLNDGQYYAYIPNDVLDPHEGRVPAIKVNGTSIAGSRTDNIGAKIELTAEGAFEHDVYVVVAKSESEGHISAHVYGALEKEKLNEADKYMEMTDDQIRQAEAEIAKARAELQAAGATEYMGYLDQAQAAIEEAKAARAKYNKERGKH